MSNRSQWGKTEWLLSNEKELLMATTSAEEVAPQPKGALRSLPRNVWVVTLTSLLTDVSSEMVINLLPLFLANVLGVKTNVIGLIEGIAETTSSVLKVFSGWL